MTLLTALTLKMRTEIRFLCKSRIWNANVMAVYVISDSILSNFWAFVGAFAILIERCNERFAGIHE